MYLLFSEVKYELDPRNQVRCQTTAVRAVFDLGSTIYRTFLKQIIMLFYASCRMNVLMYHWQKVSVNKVFNNRVV